MYELEDCWIDRWKYGVCVLRVGKEIVCKGNCKLVGGEEVGFCRFLEGVWCSGFY